MKIHDISLLLSDEMVTWPGDESIKITSTSSIDFGGVCNVSSIKMSVHSGTHIDAPFHFIKNGKYTDSVDLNSMMGVCLMVDLENIEGYLIEVKHIYEYDFSKYNRVLFKTKNSNLWHNSDYKFCTDFISLSSDAALYLVKEGVNLVGIDYLSIESFHSKSYSVHKTLLENEVVILEGIDLSKINAGTYDLVCLPIKLSECDGAPARAILREII